MKCIVQICKIKFQGYILYKNVNLFNDISKCKMLNYMFTYTVFLRH